MRPSNLRWSLSRPGARAAIACLPFPASTTASCPFMRPMDSDSDDDSDYVPPPDNGKPCPFPTLRIAHCARTGNGDGSDADAPAPKRARTDAAPEMTSTQDTADTKCVRVLPCPLQPP